MTSKIVTQTELIPAKIAHEIIKLTQLKQEINDKLDGLKAQLLEFAQQHDVYSLRTGDYTISRGKRQTINILDHQAAAESLFSLGVEPHLVEVLAPAEQMLVKGLVKKGKKINGVTHQETEYISVKVAKEDK